MLKGLTLLLFPSLLHVRASIGHGDEIVLADAKVTSATNAGHLNRQPGTSAPAALDAALVVLPLDSFYDHATFSMQEVVKAAAVPALLSKFGPVLRQHSCGPFVGLERFTFYTLATAAFAIDSTGEPRIYGNKLPKKDVVYQ